MAETLVTIKLSKTTYYTLQPETTGAFNTFIYSGSAWRVI